MENQFVARRGIISQGSVTFPQVTINGTYTVTKDDYIVRALSMPADYGVVSKVYISQDLLHQEQSTVAHTQNYNPLSLDLYILSYNNNKQLTTASTTLKQNLITYLNQYRMVTDAINILDGFVINIGVDFEITVLPNYNSSLVITNCITQLQNYFLTFAQMNFAKQRVCFVCFQNHFCIHLRLRLGR